MTGFLTGGSYKRYKSYEGYEDYEGYRVTGLQRVIGVID